MSCGCELGVCFRTVCAGCAHRGQHATPAPAQPPYVPLASARSVRSSGTQLPPREYVQEPC